MLAKLVLFVSILVLGSCRPSHRNQDPFKHLYEKRAASSGSGLRVDLGYEIYRGYYNSTSGLNNWKGIRYAASAGGANRWQAPQPPAMNRGMVINADVFGPACPQSPAQPQPYYGAYGDEDCLFLSVYAPPGAKNLPVLMWIHGGGYGEGAGVQSLDRIIAANNHSFVGVVIQYRLGAFGFLSSDEVYRRGAVNAGLLDQHFAIQWTQTYIGLFGGNASQVTIFGESAGGGSVMHQVLAYGGTLGTSLFQNAIVNSPYLPTQYSYADWQPSQSYYAYATAAGCPPSVAYGATNNTIFDCLVSKDTDTLQNATIVTSDSGIYGTWAFIPVTDYEFVDELPSQQLLQKKINGRHLLAGNNADEGIIFTPKNISTEADLVNWLHILLPLMTTDDLAKILYYYPSTNASVNASAPEYATLGDAGSTSLNQSDVATGQEQRAMNIYAETTFVCPSYWMAEAFTNPGYASYKYQYSVPTASHGSDIFAYFGPALPDQGPDLELAVMQMFGNFIKHNNPSISAVVANGADSAMPYAANPVTNWPPYALWAPYQIDLNQTGGTPYNGPVIYTQTNATQDEEPGLFNNFTLVNAYTWEGGRGTRCDFWRSVARLVPE